MLALGENVLSIFLLSILSGNVHFFSNMFYDFLCTAAAVLDWQFEFWATILALRSVNIIDMIKNFRERWPFHLIFHVMLEVLCELMLPTRI